MVPKSRTLVVDDDNDLLESAAAILGANGYEVLVADNGKAGTGLTKRESIIVGVYVEGDESCAGGE